MIAIAKRTLAAVAITLGLGGAAHATDYCPPEYKAVVCYETVTCYETKQVPYQKAVVKYDHCGRAYTTYATCYKTVTVAVTKTVPVVKYVKVATYY
jgi:hypothetical protein